MLLFELALLLFDLCLDLLQLLLLFLLLLQFFLFNFPLLGYLLIDLVPQEIQRLLKLLELVRAEMVDVVLLLLDVAELLEHVIVSHILLGLNHCWLIIHAKNWVGLECALLLYHILLRPGHIGRILLLPLLLAGGPLGFLFHSLWVCLLLVNQINQFLLSFVKNVFISLRNRLILLLF